LQSDKLRSLSLIDLDLGAYPEDGSVAGTTA